MIDPKQNIPAFPVAECHQVAADIEWTAGMTLLDYFAAKAMQSLLIGYYMSGGNAGKGISQEAYDSAEAMLAERERRMNGGGK